MKKFQTNLLVSLMAPAIISTAIISSAITTVDAGDGLIINQTNISGNALSDSRGIIGVNMAAGDENAQVNARAIVIGEGVPVLSDLNIQQRIHNKLTLGSPSYNLDYIGGDAFAGSAGIISINQTAGSGTAQANLVSIGIGGGNAVQASQASMEQLLMSYGKVEGSLEGYEGKRSDIIDGNAFSGSHGLVVVNQSAGSANRVFNTVAIQFKVIEIP
ncbi:MAG: hypothetical protein AB1325_10830 [Nitrospirota bacterium]